MYFIFPIYISIKKCTQSTRIHKNTSIFSPDKFLFHLLMLIHKLCRRCNFLIQHTLHISGCILGFRISPVEIIATPEINKLCKTVINICIFPCISISVLIWIFQTLLQNIKITGILYLIESCLFQQFLIYPEHHNVHLKRDRIYMSILFTDAFQILLWKAVPYFFCHNVFFQWFQISLMFKLRNHLIIHGNQINILVPRSQDRGYFCLTIIRIGWTFFHSDFHIKFFFCFRDKILKSFIICINMHDRQLLFIFVKRR